MSNISDTRYACQVGSYMSTTVGNKMYITGGYNLVCNATANGCVNDEAEKNPIMNNDLIVVDFTQPFTWNPRRIGKRTRVHDAMPNVRWGTLWGVGKKIYQFGGEKDQWAAESLTGGQPAPPRPEIGREVWEYDIEENSWVSTPQETEWGGVVEPVSQGAYACGGGDICYLLLGKTENEMSYNGSLLAYNVRERKWLDIQDTQGSIEKISGARMVYVEAIDMLLVVGGEVVGSNIPRRMSTIKLFHIQTKTWYDVEATRAPNEPNEPVPPRINFCAAVVSAPDGTSHSLYIWGGRRTNEDRHDSYNSVWVLTMPGFLYSWVSKAEIGREGLGCSLIDKRYLVLFSGRAGPFWRNKCDTTLENGIMWDVSTSMWTGLYQRPVGEPEYRLPPELYTLTGGTANGGANRTGPPGGVLSPSLSQIFAAAVSTAGSTTGPPAQVVSSNWPESKGAELRQGTSTGAIAGGVVGGVLGLGLLLVMLWWIRRRRNSRTGRVVEQDVQQHPVIDQQEVYPGVVRLPQAQEDIHSQPNFEAPPRESARELDSTQKYEVVGSQPTEELDSIQKYEIVGSQPTVELDGIPVQDSARGRWRTR